MLGYCILTSYYMGFMLCVFAALYYLANLIIIATTEPDQRGAGIFYSLRTFAGASIVAAGLAGITLIPGIIAVSRTAAATEAGAVFTEISGSSLAH